MIDINNEHLVSIHDLPRLLPARPNGKRVHISAVYRWMNRGTRGVVLEAVKIGGSTFTSKEALQRFVGALTLATHRVKTPNHDERVRRSELANATSRLAKLLGPRRASVNDKPNTDLAPNVTGATPQKR